MNYTNATGRRKTAVAQVWIAPGRGEITVNKTPFHEYFPIEVYRRNVIAPLKATKQEGRLDIKVNVRGGGKSGQTGAIQLAIARALVEIDSELHDKLRSGGFLTRDPRMVERKKYGQKKARKRFQFSKR